LPQPRHQQPQQPQQKNKSELSTPVQQLTDAAAATTTVTTAAAAATAFATGAAKPGTALITPPYTPDTAGACGYFIAMPRPLPADLTFAANAAAGSISRLASHAASLSPGGVAGALEQAAQRLTSAFGVTAAEAAPTAVSTPSGVLLRSRAWPGRVGSGRGEDVYAANAGLSGPGFFCAGC
jgi:hypothetical protein